MVWGFCYLRIFKKMHSISGRSLQGIRCLTVTICFVCHQKPHSLQPNQIYGNLVTNIPKS
jgi:hypothetical protein